MRHLMIYLLALLAQHHIGEVVVLVDDEIHRDAKVVGSGGNHGQLVVAGCCFKELLDEIVRIVRSVFPDERIQLTGEKIIKPPGQFVNRPTYLREVKVHHLISAHQRRGVLPYPKRTEQLLKLVLLGFVVVGLEHTQQQTLAKAPRTDEHEIAGLVLQQGNVHGLIHVVETILHDGLKV